MKFHFTGIGGVGMAGVAFLLKKAGHAVSGCDLHASPRTRWLESNGIPVAIGHSPDHITPDLDVCVFTPAVPKDNPEFIAAQSSTCSVRYRGEVLAKIFNATDGIAVCGTHGKTTTATFIAKLLRALGDAPAWCIGGETDDFPVAGISATHEPSATNSSLIIEADESDGTLALYRAKTLVVTSLDYDHPDHFKTYDDYLACYQKAMAAADDIIESAKLPTDDWPEIRPLVLGEHNVRNARTAVEVALRRGHSRAAILAALPDALSALPDRRFEQIWPLTPHPSPLTLSPSHPLIITDYAHHPAEIACALAMARALTPKRLRVMFQPHRYSRTKALLNEFPPAFAEADEIVLIPVYPAFEEPIPGGDIADLYAAFRNTSPSHLLTSSPSHPPPPPSSSPAVQKRPGNTFTSRMNQATSSWFLVQVTSSTSSPASKPIWPTLTPSPPHPRSLSHLSPSSAPAASPTGTSSPPHLLTPSPPHLLTLLSSALDRTPGSVTVRRTAISSRLHPTAKLRVLAPPFSPTIPNWPSWRASPAPSAVGRK